MNQRRSREESDQLQDEGAPAGKQRRISRACNQCRSRKQRCDGQSHLEPLQSCQRCCQLGFTCSFTTTPVENEIENSAIAIKKVGKIQKQLWDHQKRISDLEETLRELRKTSTASENGRDNTNNVQKVISANEAPDRHASEYNGTPPSINGATNVNQVISSTGTHMEGLLNFVDDTSTLSNSAPAAVFQTPAESTFTMDAVDLDTPMTTLRNIVSLSKESVTSSPNMTYDPIFPMISREERQAFEHDPVAQGILTMEEAQQAFDIFFSNCHPMAPFLCIQSQRSAAFVRQSSPALFLSVCAVGTRFWQTANSQTSCQGLHNNYRAIVELLDSSMSRLLLQPNLSDVTLDHIRCLLLYIQWMPVEQNTSGISQTRYNDISAWSVLGLAIRYSLFLGLDRSAIAPFSPYASKSPGQEDFARLRVWVNVLTCDCHLMLSAGLPGALDPEPVAKVGRAFSSNKNALQPDDSRVAAISELATVVKRAARDSGDPRVRVLDAVSLKKANIGFDNWESFWTAELTRNNCQHSQMPFTSLRWYRLVINSAGLGSILSRNKPPEQRMQLSLLQSLDTSLLAAAQTIFSLSNETNTQTWPSQSHSLPAFPLCPFTVDMVALGKFRFSVDSSWITHSFAAVFLVLCYTRGAIDDELQILQLVPQSSHNLTIAPSSPRSTSLFYRLISLASQIFDTICRSSATAHPAADYRSIIHNVFSVILGSSSQTNDETEVVYQGGEITDQMSMDALFEMMFSGSEGYNWQGGLFKEDGAEITRF